MLASWLFHDTVVATHKIHLLISQPPSLSVWPSGGHIFLYRTASLITLAFYGAN